MEKDSKIIICLAILVFLFAFIFPIKQLRIYIISVSLIMLAYERYRTCSKSGTLNKKKFSIMILGIILFISFFSFSIFGSDMLTPHVRAIPIVIGFFGGIGLFLYGFLFCESASSVEKDKSVVSTCRYYSEGKCVAGGYTSHPCSFKNPKDYENCPVYRYNALGDVSALY